MISNPVAAFQALKISVERNSAAETQSLSEEKSTSSTSGA